ncbi:MAG: lipid-A-disaccharide synthase [Cucumibacter sp.]
MRLFILAGEPSGDRIGAALVTALRQRTVIELTGIGGPALGEAGLESIFPMHDLSVMGYTDVLARLPLLLWRLNQTVAAIRRTRPDIVVLIDAQEFSYRVGRAVRRFALGLPILLYVAPTVWGWKPERAGMIAPIFTEVLAVFPFEPAAMARLGGPPTSYVGHPAIGRLGAAPAPGREADLLALLPGSRPGEVRRHLPMLIETAALLRADMPELRFVLPTLPMLEPMVRAAAKTRGLDVAIVTGRGEAEAAMRRAMMAVAAMGTVTLELAAAGTPMVAFYVADRIQPRLYDRIRPRFVSLPNILLDRPVVEELLFRAPDAIRLAKGALRLLRDPDARQAQRRAFAEIRQLMAQGLPDAPRVDAADRVLALTRRLA